MIFLEDNLFFMQGNAGVGQCRVGRWCVAWVGQGVVGRQCKEGRVCVGWAG